MTCRPSVEREGINAQRDDVHTNKDNEKQELESRIVVWRTGNAGHLEELQLRERETRTQLVNAKAKLQQALRSAGVAGAERGTLRKIPHSARQHPEAVASCNSAVTPDDAVARGRRPSVPISEQDPPSKRPGNASESINAPRRVSLAHLDVVKQEATQRWKTQKANQLAQTLVVCFVGKLEYEDQGEADDRVKFARGTVGKAVGIHTSVLVMAASTEDGRPTTEAAKYRQYLKLLAQGKINPHMRIISERQFLQQFPARGSARTRASDAATSPARAIVQPPKSPRSGPISPRASAAAKTALTKVNETKEIDQVPSESDLRAFHDYNAHLRQCADSWIFETCPVYEQSPRFVYHEQSQWETIRDAGKWNRQMRQEVHKRLENKVKVKEGVGSFKHWFSEKLKSPRSRSSPSSPSESKGS